MQKSKKLKNIKQKTGKYFERSYVTPTGKKVVGHFVFNLTKSQLKKNFQEILRSYF